VIFALLLFQNPDVFMGFALIWADQEKVGFPRTLGIRDNNFRRDRRRHDSPLHCSVVVTTPGWVTLSWLQDRIPTLHCHGSWSVRHPCLTSHTESDTPDTPVEPASVIHVIDRQGAACDEASRRGATEPRRRRGVAPTARRRGLDRRRSAGVRPGAPVVFLAPVCPPGGHVQPEAAAGHPVWRQAEEAPVAVLKRVIGWQRWRGSCGGRVDGDA